MVEIFVSLPKIFFNKMIIKWMNSNIQIVSQLPKVNVWNKYNQQREQMYKGREEL